MKKIVLLFGLVIIAMTNYAQSSWIFSPWTIYANPTTTKIGIGITLPDAPLHIAGANGADAAILATTSTEDNRLIIRSETTQPTNCLVFRIQHSFLGDRNNGFINFYRGTSTYGGFLTFGTNGVERIRINSLGNVGIGKINPMRALDVNGDVAIPFNKLFMCGPNAGAGQRRLVIFHTGTHGYIDYNDNLHFRTDGELSALTLYGNGGVGIGFAPTYNAGHYKNMGYRLAVKGGIVCEEVKVILNVPDADYVFEEDYSLTPLSEVETFIKENKHLPNIPSAEEFRTNGYKLGDMDGMLLRKVEELTLYAIEQQKLIEELQKRLLELEGKKGGE